MKRLFMLMAVAALISSCASYGHKCCGSDGAKKDCQGSEGGENSQGGEGCKTGGCKS